MARAKAWMGAVVALVTAAGGGCFFIDRDEPSVLVCTPGEEEACYSGPPGTSGIGACAEGRRYCLPDGTGFWPCAAEVLPGVETCGDLIDNDCNGVKDDVAGCLVDRGLVTRHFIDEATFGQGPSQLYDATPDPLDLDINYSPGLIFDADGPNYTGLLWANDSSAGHARRVVNGSKLLDRFDGSRGLTVELVIRLDGTGSVHNKHIVSLGDLRLASVYGEFRFYECYGCYAAATGDGGSFISRSVLHLVVDFEKAPSYDWVQMYANGYLVSTASFQPSGSEIQLQADDAYILGGSNVSPYSFTGTIFYAAIYDAALTDDEIQHNAQTLLVSDDRP